MAIKCSDFIIDFLQKNGCEKFFGVTGGAAVHLFDSVEKNPKTEAVYFNHEQSASFAVNSYSRYKNKLGVGIFTTGPGATNALTGLTAAWLDSIPCIFISGQARTNQTINGRNLRQVGTQEIDIVPMVKSVTKYAKTIYSLTDVKYELQKAIYFVSTGRPGPVWLDIPVDIGWSFIKAKDQIPFYPSKEEIKKYPTVSNRLLNEISKNLKQSLLESKKPIIVAGYGIRLSNAESLVKKFIKNTKIPYVVTWSNFDTFDSEDKLNLGCPGIAGHRGANLGLHNSDLIIAIGSHLNSSIVTVRPTSFAPNARIIMIDIDKNETDNSPLNLTQSINCDINKLFTYLDKTKFNYQNTNKEWFKYTSKYREQNLIALNYQKNTDKINSYYFQHVLSKMLDKSYSYVIDGGGTIVYSSFQSLRIKKNQKVILSTSLCSMGSGIPESIGVHYADKKKKIICFIGDGSLPFNVQELQLISNIKMPITIFVFNNNGYTSIKSTQNEFLDKRFYGSTPNTGLHLLNIKNISKAFNLKYKLLTSQSGLHSKLKEITSEKIPTICEVLISEKQEIVPRQGFSSDENGIFSPLALDDMYPYLDRSLYNSLSTTRSGKHIKLPGKEINLTKTYPHEKKVGVRTPKKVNLIQDMDEDLILNSHDESGTILAGNLLNQYILKNFERFGKSYFDGKRSEGYGGYYYDSKFFKGVARDIIKHYKITKNSKILEIGCAKGFLLYELKKLVPGVTLSGIDISKYAVKNAHPKVKRFIRTGSVDQLPYEDRKFDLVICLNTLNEVPKHLLEKAIQEIERVKKLHSYISIYGSRSVRDLDKYHSWNISAESYFSVNEWKKLLFDFSYSGDYSWVDMEVM